MSDPINEAEQQFDKVVTGEVEPEPLAMDDVATTTPSTPVAEPIIEKPIIEKPIIKQNVTIAGPWNRPFGVRDTDPDIISMPAGFSDDVSEVLASIPNINIGTTREGKIWARSLGDGLEQSSYNDTFKSTLEDPEAHFSNYVEAPAGRLMGRVPRIQDVSNAVLTGEKAVIRVMTELGLGAPFQTPLWSSGMWVTFKTPSEADLIELHRIIVEDKVELGRHTYGLVFSNISAYTIERLINFAFNNSFLDITIKTDDIPAGGIKQLIVAQDIPNVLWGLTRAIYMNGFAYDRACIANPAECTHVEKMMLDVEKLQLVNNSALTDWQKIHMSGRAPNSKSLADIQRYQSELLKIQDQELKIDLKDENKNLTFILKTPTIADYIDSGHRWITNIVNMVDDVLGTETDTNVRNNLIERHAQATTMCQYAQWVGQIKVNSNSIEDKDTIESNLKRLSQDSLIHSQFITGVTKYIERSTISVIAIPSYNCPKCGKSAKEPGQKTTEEFDSVIPLDMVQVFFGLLQQRIVKISKR